MIKRDKKTWKNMDDRDNYLLVSQPSCYDSSYPIDLSNMESGFTDYLMSVDSEHAYSFRGKPPIYIDRSTFPFQFFVLPLLFCNLCLAVEYALGEGIFEIEAINFSFEPSIQAVINYVDSLIVPRAHVYTGAIRNKVWSMLNSIIDFSRCLVFRYNFKL